MVCGIIQHGYVILDVGKVNIPAQELLDRLDLNDVCLGQKLKEGLEATKIVSGATVPDNNVRAKYLDMAFKLKNKEISYI